jgi:hypothetical protein
MRWVPVLLRVLSSRLGDDLEARAEEAVSSLLKCRRRRKEALISAAFPKEFEPPRVGSYKEWSFSTGGQAVEPYFYQSHQ